tara:strand:+ start:79231 stop:80127 length:897 start_codon:yes stop_codon:yes gene_type:complete
MVARRLGYLGNPIRDWEAGRRFPTAGETFRAASLLGIDVLGGMQRFHQPSAQGLDMLDDQGIAVWLGRLRGNAKVLEIAEQMEQSRYTISRWLKGETKPRLPHFLQLVDAITGRASDLLFEFVADTEVPAVAELHRQRTSAREVAFHEPWTEAVMRLFETEAFRNHERGDVDWIAERLGILPSKAKACVERMLASGIIVTQDGRIHPSKSLTIYTGGDPSRTRLLKSHWAQVATERLEQSHSEDWFAYNVMSISRADLERVKSLMRDTYKEIRAIVASSEPEQAVALVQLQLIDWSVD